jgi:serine/threonine-protein kinase
MGRAKALDVGSQTLDLGAGRHLKLLDLLGKGSAGTVYRAYLSSPLPGAGTVDRPVAVKLFTSLASDDCEQIATVVAGITRRLAYVAHPNVAQVYECGVWNARPYIVSELVSGVSLSSLALAFRAKRRRLPLDVALFVSVEVGDALAGAHLARDHEGIQLAMVHHAVSAREVLLSWRGEVKVTDFETSTARAAGSCVRTLRGVATRAAMMAPEVAQGREADSRSDVFSFGVLLRELLIGQRFPDGLTDAEAIRLAREGYVKPLTFQPHLPEGLLAIVNRALQVDPEQRYPNACAMAFDLRREAFAMGVGDGRYFLRRVLEREWVQYADEITAQAPLPHQVGRISPALEPVEGYDDVPVEPPTNAGSKHGGVVELKRRR